MEPLEKLLSRIQIVDTETTSVDFDTAEIIEIGSAVWNSNIDNWMTQSILMGSWGPIPPEASAVHNISNRMVSGLPKFSETIPEVTELLGFGHVWVAHNAKFDQQILTRNFEKLNLSEPAAKLADSDNWICTMRLAKQLLIPDFELTTFSLNYFRYCFDLPAISGNQPLHRAEADCLVCAEFLKFLASYGLESGKLDPSIDLVDQLIALSWAPISVLNWPFGKYRGTELTKIPTDYYMWAMKNIDALNDELPNYDADLAASVAAVLEHRGF